MSNKFVGLLISLVAMGVFYGFAYLAFRLSFGKGFIRRNFAKKHIIMFGIFLGITMLFVAFIVSRNEYVYTWDSAGYWTWSYQHMNDIYTNPSVALGNLGVSVVESDYNLIAPTIVSLPLKIFGYTFTRYVIINYVMFVIPSIIVAVCIMKKIYNNWAQVGEEKLGNVPFLLMAFATIVFFVSRLIPLFQGYIDFAILIPILLLLALAMSFDPTRKINGRVLYLFVLAELLVMVFLLRRYTAFFVVGYVVSLFVVSLISVGFRRVKRLFINFLFFGGTAFLTIMVFFHGLVFRILKEDYVDLYSAYNATFGEKIGSLVTRFGLVFLIIALCGVVVSLKLKRSRRFTAFCFLTIVVVVALFFRVQRMDGHHSLIITPMLFVLYSIGLCALYCTKRKHVFVLKLTVVLLLLAEPCYIYLESIPKRVVAVGGYIFGQKYYPLRRSDMGELYRMRDYLNSTNTNNSIVYVLSSSVNFNWNTLSNLDKPYSEWAVNGQVMTHDVDLRDGFPGIFFDSDIIVIADPIQLHLRDGSQEVIRYLAEQIQAEKSYLGRHFKKDEESFNLEMGVNVYIYRKISSFTANDYGRLIDYFDSRYPNHEPLFGERIREYARSVL